MSTNKISMVYYIAGLMGKSVGYEQAIKIAESFTRHELVRIYLKVKARTA